eukprot:COSAG01_NODE_1072_length_11863_cov_13.614587_6_plen_165_part_00
MFGCRGRNKALQKIRNRRRCHSQRSSKCEELNCKGQRNKSHSEISLRIAVATHISQPHETHRRGTWTSPVWRPVLLGQQSGQGRWPKGTTPSYRRACAPRRGGGYVGVWLRYAPCIFTGGIAPRGAIPRAPPSPPSWPSPGQNPCLSSSYVTERKVFTPHDPAD